MSAAAAASSYEAVIGLEIHCQLATASKIFCACPARAPDGVSVADVGANASSCPVCAGHPGTLPVLNRRAVEYAVRAGLAANCRIRERSEFSRKNYFYPDLPKGYQVSQYDLPICEGGWLEVPAAGGGTKRVTIQRIHLEEDAGKSTHLAGFSLVNLNRAGVPLIEIVSGPDLSTAQEAGAYMRAIHAIVTFLGISDGNLQEGNFRCDANVSVRPAGARELGTRVEIKNVNSFRFIEKAIEYEIARQVEVVRSGGAIALETRGFDAARGVTVSQRSKEEAQDYRYFPEPDLLPVVVDPAWVEEIRRSLPELPARKSARYVAELGLSPYDAGVLTGSKALAEFFERAVERCARAPEAAATAPKLAANLVTGELARLLNDEDVAVEDSRVRPEHVADLVLALRAQELSSTQAKQVLQSAWRTGDAVAAIIEREGLRQVSDAGALGAAVDRVIAENGPQFAELLAGKEKVMGFLVGQVMKATGGKANPTLAQGIIKERARSAKGGGA